MSANLQNDLKAIDSKLRRFVDCVMKKAKGDDAFALELRRILLSGTQPDHSEKKPKPLQFEPVSFLHAQGEEKLRHELSLKTDSELRTILKAEGVLRGKEAKVLERQFMISEIVQYAVRKLNQGSAFLDIK